MSPTVLVCGKVFDGVSEGLTGPAEILVEGNQITNVGRSVNRSPGVQVIDLSDRTVAPGFIDTHVHLTMDAANPVRQTLESSASKALKGLSLTREYMNCGFTTLRDLAPQTRNGRPLTFATPLTRDLWKDLGSSSQSTS